MAEEMIANSLKDLPFALLFALFLILSFRQRAATMAMMAEIVKEFTKTISNCCDDDEEK
jgi:hypothetical protein